MIVGVLKGNITKCKFQSMNFSIDPPFTVYTANSKKVVLRKSKIQITKYKIRIQSMSHDTHKWTFNFQSVIYTVQGGFSVKWNISKSICLHLKAITKYFDLRLCILEFRFCIFKGQPFLN